jgi:peptide/nickel transport system permease protein
MKLSPGDPTMIYKDPHVAMEDIQQIRENLGLNKPIFVQFYSWLKQTLTGNLGYSFVSGEPVTQLILSRLGPTLLLSIASLILILIITFFLGLYSGYKAYGIGDQLIMIISFIGLSMPSFWIGILLILGFSEQLNLFPSSGYIDPSVVNKSIFIRSINILQHMALPLLTIVIGGIAGLTRYNRYGIIDVMQQPFILAARARQIPEKIILFKHAAKNALLPLITILGLQLPGLISGSFIIEFIFAWPGLGQLGVQAIFSRDYPVLMATILFSSILIIVGNLLSDMMYSYADPRIKRK